MSYIQLSHQRYDSTFSNIFMQNIKSNWLQIRKYLDNCANKVYHSKRHLPSFPCNVPNWQNYPAVWNPSSYILGWLPFQKTTWTAPLFEDHYHQAIQSCRLTILQGKFVLGVSQCQLNGLTSIHSVPEDMGKNEIIFDFDHSYVCILYYIIEI